MKARDIPPTTLRLDPTLRDELLREATINGRSLSKEIEHRLRDSFAAVVREYGGQGKPRALTAEDSVAARLRDELPDSHRHLLALFDALTPDRQLALLTLLRR